MKMTCAHCGHIDECSCPEDHAKDFPDAKYACAVCMELKRIGIADSELAPSPLRKEAEENIHEFAAE